MHKRPGVGSLPSSIISKKNFFADAISARTFAFVISAFAMLSSPLMFAQTVSPAPIAITNSPAVNALPTGGRVVAGQVVISQTSTAILVLLSTRVAA